MLSSQIFYTGRTEPPQALIDLRAGPLKLLFDGGDLRSICLGEREIVRRIYAAVRDRNWGTVPGRVSNLQINLTGGAFAIDYDAEHRQGEIDFAWHAVLRGSPDGHITFALDGKARSTFLKNRIGFCVLFPAGSAGQPVTIEHTNGSRDEMVFPMDISADQPVRPFDQISALTLSLGASGEAVVRFSGEVFEMEDQRLWTDASYKVFGTPLALPFPVEIQAGTRVAQQIELTAGAVFRAGQVDTVALEKDAAPPVMFSLPEDGDGDAYWKPLPELGVGCASHKQELSAREIERLKALNLHHLRVDLALAGEDYPMCLERAAREAAALGIGLEAALLVTAQDAPAQLRRLREHLERVRPRVGRWLVYPDLERYGGGSPVEPVLREARRQLTDYDKAVPFAAGTNNDFIFLKRTPPPVNLIDCISTAMNPQAHAFDDLSLVETLEAQPVVVESARRLAGGLPVVVSPITLKPRFNPYATESDAPAVADTLPPQVDARQRSLFGAGWTLGSLRAMVLGGAASVTYYETTGWRGTIERDSGSPWPADLPAWPGAAFPLYHVLADAGEFAGGQAAALVSGEQGDHLCVSGLALRLDGREAVLLANHTAQAQRVVIGGRQGNWTARMLAEATVEQSMTEPEAYRRSPGTARDGYELTVQPFGYARLDHNA